MAPFDPGAHRSLLPRATVDWRAVWHPVYYNHRMPRRKTPSEAEMAAFVAVWLRRLDLGAARADALERADVQQAYPEGANAQERLKAEYQGWAAVAWIEEHAEALSEQTASQQLTAVKVRAGNSREKQLWRERVVYVGPLGAHYRLPKKTWAWVLRDGALAGHLPAIVAPSDVARRQQQEKLPAPYLMALANKPSVLIDRATRGAHGWDGVTLQYREAFEDGLTLNYYEENAEQEHLRAQLMTLDPRTSDVWRLLTAKALENDRDDLFAPIKIRPGELAKALGLKLHPNGSVRPKDLVRCTQSLFHLERLWLTLGDAKGEDEEGTRKRVLAVMERARGKRIDGQMVPSSWTIVLGDWARYFPRSYAPIFRNLVELPANSATNLWAKQIGTELTYWIRETADDPRRTRPINVQTLLVRASVMHEVLELRERKNQNRAIERFEGTLDLLRKLGVHEGWAYAPEDAARLDRLQGKPAFFPAWLASLVVFEVPERFLRAIAELVEGEAATG